MVKKRTIYTASDGKEFDNEKEAEEHDKKVIRELIKVYKVYYNPDLNRIVEIIDKDYRTILNEIGKLRSKGKRRK